MVLSRRSVIVGASTFVGLALVAALAGSAVFAKKAKAPRPKKAAERYLLQVIAVEHDDGVTRADLDAQTRETLAAAIMARPDDFVVKVDGAPDPKADAGAYQAFLAKQKVKAFDVRVRFRKYERTLTPVPGSNDQVLGIALDLELLGARPDGSLAFTGKGSAQVTAQVGKKVPPKMDAGLHADALKGALEHALAEAVIELRAAKPTPPPKK
jgi:hypothetical protein